MKIIFGICTQILFIGIIYSQTFLNIQISSSNSPEEPSIYINPKNTKNLKRLANIQILTGNLGEAEALIQKCINFEPKDSSHVVDLGKMDILVEEGFYSNRTDFIKTAIRNQLSNHAEVLNKVITKTSYNIGVTYYSRKDLEKISAENKQLVISQVGMLKLDKDINKELALKTIKSLKVFGVLRGSDEVKNALKDRIL